MKRKIILSSQYKKDIKLARRRNLPEEELNEIVLKLANDVSLSAKNKDHALQGEFVGCRECHIRPDWLLIYRKTDNNEYRRALLQQCRRVSCIWVHPKKCRIALETPFLNYTRLASR